MEREMNIALFGGKEERHHSRKLNLLSNHTNDSRPRSILIRSGRGQSFIDLDLFDSKLKTGRQTKENRSSKSNKYQNQNIMHVRSSGHRKERQCSRSSDFLKCELLEEKSSAVRQPRVISERKMSELSRERESKHSQERLGRRREKGIGTSQGSFDNINIDEMEDSAVMGTSSLSRTMKKGKQPKVKNFLRKGSNDNSENWLNLTMPRSPSFHEVDRENGSTLRRFPVVSSDSGQRNTVHKHGLASPRKKQFSENTHRTNAKYSNCSTLSTNNNRKVVKKRRKQRRVKRQGNPDYQSLKESDNQEQRSSRYCSGCKTEIFEDEEKEGSSLMEFAPPVNSRRSPEESLENILLPSESFRSQTSMVEFEQKENKSFEVPQFSKKVDPRRRNFEKIPKGMSNVAFSRARVPHFIGQRSENSPLRTPTEGLSANFNTARSVVSSAASFAPGNPSDMETIAGEDMFSSPLFYHEDVIEEMELDDLDGIWNLRRAAKKKGIFRRFRKTKGKPGV